MSYDSPERTAFEIAHAIVCNLIDRFEKCARDNYLLPGYSEAAELYGLSTDEIALVEGNA